jgi:N-acetylmuramoyl-L-alanine amidase
VIKRAIILISTMLLMAGCASTSPGPGEATPEEVVSSPLVMTDATSSLNWTAPDAVAPFPAPRNFRQPARLRPAAPATTYTSLDRWAAENQVAAPRQVSRAPTAAYAVKTAGGTMVVDIGSREASWNGAEVQLGFAPQIIDDQVFVHGLDLQKNLEPLLLGPPLSFGNRVIVIDPGHGGTQTGTHSVADGRYEKEFTLDWALRLAPLLETNGWKVFLTRTSDMDVALSNRVAFAEAHQADVFISLHFNSSGSDSRQAGIETYCSTPAGMPSNLTRNYADIVTQTFPNNAYDGENLQLAVRLHAALLRATGAEDRGVRRARFIGVLHGQRHPAVLLEGGYLSNPREARLIATPEYRQKLAEAVAEALK